VIRAENTKEKNNYEKDNKEKPTNETKKRPTLFKICPEISGKFSRRRQPYSTEFVFIEPIFQTFHSIYEIAIHSSACLPTNIVCEINSISIWLGIWLFLVCLPVYENAGMPKNYRFMMEIYILFISFKYICACEYQLCTVYSWNSDNSTFT
jgi:hypothetical protein